MGDAAQFDKRFKDRLWKIIAAALIMGIVLWGIGRALVPLTEGSDLIRFLAVVILCSAGMVAYGIAGIALKAFTLADLRTTFRRTK